MTRSAAIIGTGMAMPSKVLTNDDMAKIVDTSDEWIRTRTGIRERRIADDGVNTSDLGAEAALQALKNAGVAPEEVDLIILATLSPRRGSRGRAAATTKRTTQKGRFSSKT